MAPIHPKLGPATRFPLAAAVGLLLVAGGAATQAQDGPLTENPVWTYVGTQAFSSLGRSVSSAGDVNGDGFADIIVGEPNLGATGRVLVFHGSATGLSPTPSWTVTGPGGNFGYSVSTAGDVNGDDFDDVIVGASGYSNGEASEGAAFVYLGSALGLAATPAWSFEADEISALLGWSVSDAGDVNGDDFGDVIVGAYRWGVGGAAFVFHGSPTGPSPTPDWSDSSSVVNNKFAYSVAWAGDVNDDGFDDVIVGDPAHENDLGGAFVYLGSATGLWASADWDSQSDQEDSQFGHVVSRAGDVNGDGFDDVIVGAWQYDNASAVDEDHGAAFVYYGSGSGPALSPSWQVSDAEEYSGLGRAADSAGDVNGDGFDDVAIGNDYPRGRLHLGSSGGLSTDPDWTDDAAGQFFDAVATAGDVNGDGPSDLIVGNAFANFDSQGAAYVYHGVGPGLTLALVDPNPELLVGPDITTDPDMLAALGRPVTGLSADSVTPIVLRVITQGPGGVEFRLYDEHGLQPDVGTLSTIGGNENATILPVISQPLGDGTFGAFAVLRAPDLFVRDPSDLPEVSRPIRVESQSFPDGGGGSTTEQTLNLFRPPVVLIHGLWGNSVGTWGLASEGWAFRIDPRFRVIVHDYSASHADHFAVNVPQAAAAVRAAVAKQRAHRNAAATQADVFGHSMGGLLSRMYGANVRLDYIRDNNFGQGDIHKLITVDTPHAGSPLGNLLIDISDSLGNSEVGTWVQSVAAAASFCIDCGAIEDLATDSVPITTLPALNVPSHAMVGTGGTSLLDPQLMPPKLRSLFRLLLFLSVDLDAIFGPGVEHDLIVPYDSQLGGLTESSGQATNFGFVSLASKNLGIHTSVTKESQTKPTAYELLDMPTDDPTWFAGGFPAAAPPPPGSTSARSSIPAFHSGAPGDLTIVEPLPGASVAPGQLLTVTVTAGGGFVPERVLLTTSHDSALVTTAPYTATLEVPADATGEIVISAAGASAADEYVVAASITVQASVSAALTGISVANDPLYLFSFSPTGRLTVIGDFDDGIQRDVTEGSLGTTYVSNDPSIATVDSDGRVTAVDRGQATISISNGAFAVDSTVDVSGALLDLRVEPDRLSWPVTEDAAAYDVVRGDLLTLLGTGDFSLATEECLAPGIQATEQALSATPSAGEGFWFLVRVIYGDARGAGSYSPDGAGNRDLQIAASGNGCP